MIFDKRANEAKERIDLKFWERYRTILNRCIAISEDRQDSYVGEASSILDYWIGGEADLIYEINKK